MIVLAKEVLSVLGQISTIVVAALSIPLWLETRRQRQALKRPMLLPSRLDKRPQFPGALFASNFSYPRVDEYQHTGLAYLGIKNVGTGVAIAARIELFQPGLGDSAERGDPIQIPDGEVVPLILRFGYNDSMEDLEGKSHRACIKYFDVFGERYSLQLDLWFRNLDGKPQAEAIVIQHSTNAEPMESPCIPIFRTMEYQGYFDLEKLFERDKSKAK